MSREADRDRRNYWTADPTLQRVVRRAYERADAANRTANERRSGDSSADSNREHDRFTIAQPYLRHYGRVVAETIADNANLIDDRGPILHTYDRDGEVRNHVEYHPAQFENERLTYGPDAGVVAYAFHAPPDREEPLGLLHTLSMGALLSYADPGLYCPVSMTAGVALVLDRFDDGRLEEPFDRLTTTDYDELVEGAMFLTEKQGGSDVGANETIARPIDSENGIYALEGEKWFCSNIDAEGALVLARRPDAPAGTAGLSLFLVGRTTPDGELNDMLYRRLKDKLGTISVPTGEIELRGARGVLVGEPENGFKQMATMLNFERLANAAAAVGIIGRCLLESTAHAGEREAFGETLDSFPLMKRDLVEMAVDHEAAATYTFEAATWLDRVHRDADDEHAFKLMRLLVPIAKLKTARMAVDTASYAMEIHGGNGYVNDFVTHRLLRDAQVLPIWEGATNVLALDVLRALDRESAHDAFVPEIADRLGAIETQATADGELEALTGVVREAFVDLQGFLGSLATEDPEHAQLRAKELADGVFAVVTATCLLEAALEATASEGNPSRELLVASRFVRSAFDTAGGVGTPQDRSALDTFDSIVRYNQSQ